MHGVDALLVPIGIALVGPFDEQLAQPGAEFLGTRQLGVGDGHGEKRRHLGAVIRDHTWVGRHQGRIVIGVLSFTDSQMSIMA